MLRKLYDSYIPHRKWSVVAILIFIVWVTPRVALAQNPSNSWSAHAWSIIEVARANLYQMPIKARWENVDFKFDKNGFIGNVWFAADPSYLALSMGANASEGAGIIEHDTEEAARAILKELVARGYDPTQQSINIFVAGMRHVQGETGKPMVIEYGYADYNKYSDSFEFKLCSNNSLLGC